MSKDRFDCIVRVDESAWKIHYCAIDADDVRIGGCVAIDHPCPEEVRIANIGFVGVFTAIQDAYKPRAGACEI